MRIALFTAVTLAVISANSLSATRMAVFPLAASGVEKELAAEMTKKLKEKLLPYTELVFVSSSRVDSVLQDIGSCDEPCRIEKGNALGADIVLGGLVYKDPDAYLMDVKITRVSSGISIYSMSYKCPCSLTDLLGTVPDSAAVDIIKTIQKAQAAAPDNSIEQYKDSGKSDGTEEKKAHIEITLEEKSEDDDEPEDQENQDDQDENIRTTSPFDDYNGAAERPAVGISGRWALGDLRNTESQWGAEIHGIIPVSSASHLRLRAAMPASRSSSTTKNSEGVEGPDILSALEHEWCYRNIGVVFGVSHMYMVPFEKTVSNRAYHNEAWNAYNWVLGFRAGRHHKGFRFRISYPMPFVEDYADMDNYFMEVNAFGMYGTEKFKAGAGAMAYYKKRSAESSSGGKIISEDYFVLAPCGKVSFMVANQSVISIGLDLTGIFFPSSETGIFWSPNLTLSYVFSFGDLKNPETFDGRF